jgi:exonuclease VII small subunit
MRCSRSGVTVQLKPSETEVPYEQLLAELNRLVGRIERDETGIDQLIGDVNRAYDIVAALRGRIGRTEELLAEVVSRLLGPPTPRSRAAVGKAKT